MATPVQKFDAFRKYWRDIGLALSTTLTGMRLTMRYFFTKPVTLMYPEERPLIPPGHRGIHGYDEQKCISCDMCANACPVSCIYIASTGRGKDALMTQFDIDYTKCLFCDLCTEPCPTECIWMTQEYDLASYRKSDCIVNFARTKTTEEITAHEAKLAVKEAEKKAKAAAKKEAAPAEGAEGAEAAEETSVAAAEGAAESE